MKRPHIYGSEDRCRAALKRYIDGVEDLLGQAVGVRKRIAESKYPTSPISSAFIANDWLKDFDRWFDRSGQTMRKYLQDRFASVLPVLAAGVPPDTGKPRHVIVLDAAEPWLEKAVAELRDLQAALGVRRGVTLAAPGPPKFAELHASGLVADKIVNDLGKAMASPHTPRQLANAIGSAKELAEATLRAALDRLGEPYARLDDMNALMKEVAQSDPRVGCSRRRGG